MEPVKKTHLLPAVFSFFDQDFLGPKERRRLGRRFWLKGTGEVPLSGVATDAAFTGVTFAGTGSVFGAGASALGGRSPLALPAFRF